MLRTGGWIAVLVGSTVLAASGCGGGESAARLCYSDSPEARIAEGIRRMALALRELPGAERLSWPATKAV